MAETTGFETQGESYRRFLTAVPRLVPSLRPRLPSGGKQPHWGQGLLGEIFMWLFAVSVMTFALTLSIVALWVAMGVALGGYALTKIVIRLRRRERDKLTARPAP